MSAPIDPPLVVRPRSRLRAGLGAVVALGLLGVAIAVLVTALGSHGATTEVRASPVPTTRSSSAADSRVELYVHILGAVEHPGLFVLHDGDRALDAVAAAGGFTPTADQGQLNLARPLVDGEQIVVPEIGEAPPVVSGLPPPGAGAPAVGGKVNLNAADQAALETLPRVGPALARRILDWRDTNGRFTAIEDLMSVTGIGEKTFDGLKDLVTV